MKYNGYANYETWCVNLWLNNEEPIYRFWLDATREHLIDAAQSRQVVEELSTVQDTAKARLVEQLKESLEEANPLKAADVYSDLLSAALSEVDWHEIAEGFLEGLQPALAELTTESFPKVSPQSGEVRFDLGQIVATAAAKSILTDEEIAAAITRHVRGDWGLVGPEDRQENELSLKEGFRLMSVYESTDKVRFWIITEADRDLTPETGSSSMVRIRAWSDFWIGGYQDGQEAISGGADHRQAA